MHPDGMGPPPNPQVLIFVDSYTRRKACILQSLDNLPLFFLYCYPLFGLLGLPLQSLLCTINHESLPRLYYGPPS